MIIARITPGGFVQLPDEVLHALSLAKGKMVKSLRLMLMQKNNQVIIKSSTEDTRRLLRQPRHEAKNRGAEAPFLLGQGFAPEEKVL